MKRVRDFAQIKYEGVITEEVARMALDLMEVDRMGLDHIDRNILTTIIDKFKGGRWGWIRWRHPLGKMPGRWRMYTNRFY